MIDLHSHILRGIDDGAQTMEESIDIARAALADGITAIAGTPHVRDDWPTDAGVMEYRVAELRAELHQQGIALDVRRAGKSPSNGSESCPSRRSGGSGSAGTRATSSSRRRITAGRSGSPIASSRSERRGSLPCLRTPSGMQRCRLIPTASSSSSSTACSSR